MLCTLPSPVPYEIRSGAIFGTLPIGPPDRIPLLPAQYQLSGFNFPSTSVHPACPMISGSVLGLSFLVNQSNHALCSKWNLDDNSGIIRYTSYWFPGRTVFPCCPISIIRTQFSKEYTVRIPYYLFLAINSYSQTVT